MAQRHVLMKHPDLPDAEPATTTMRAYEKVHAGKGWRLVNQRTGEYIDPVADPAKVTGDDLEAALVARGLSTEGTASEKRDRLAEVVASEPEVGTLPATVDAGDAGQED